MRDAKKSALMQWTLVACLAFLATEVRAETPPVPKQDASAPSATPEPELTASPAEIDQWLTDLQSQDFEVRKAASQKLTKVGKAAVAPLQKAADTDDLEAAARAIAVLKELSASKTDVTRDTAKAALEALTKSENRSVAARAHAALKPPVDPNVPPQGAQIIGNIRVAGGIQIGGVRGIRIQARQANGQKDIEVEEDGKKIQISENAKDGIKIEVTETVNGAKKTTTTKAKDIDDLKKNHPDAHKLYEKYAGNQGNIVLGNGAQIQIQAVPGIVPRPGPFQRRVLPRRDPNLEAANQLRKEAIEHAQEKIEKSVQELKKLAAEGKLDEEAIHSLTDEIQAAIKEISNPRQPEVPADEDGSGAAPADGEKPADKAKKTEQE